MSSPNPQTGPREADDEEVLALRANIRAERQALSRRLAWIGVPIEIVGVVAWIFLRRVARAAAGGESAKDVALSQLLVVAPAIVAAGLVLIAIAAVVYAKSNPV